MYSGWSPYVACTLGAALLIGVSWAILNLLQHVRSVYASGHRRFTNREAPKPPIQLARARKVQCMP